MCGAAGVALSMSAPGWAQQAGSPTPDLRALPAEAPLTPKQRAAARRAAQQARAAERRRAKALREAERKNADSASYRGPDGEDIVVVGLRRSVSESIDKKRRSNEVVEVITSEGAGKLPDNNVVEALARAPGVQIFRGKGQGSEVQIRGLTGVQTTINGSEVIGATSNSRSGALSPNGDIVTRSGRGMDLSTIPAELIKSVDVYKTRSVSQVEGGIAGTVNVELRRPLDLARGLTIAGSVRESYNSRGASRWSPYLSGLFGYRFETGLGDMGFLVNASYQNIKYSEPFIATESLGYFYDFINPANTFRSDAYKSLPAEVRDTALAPYRGTYGVNEGNVKNKAVNAVFQWRPANNLKLLAEATYFGNESRNTWNSLYVGIRDDFVSIEDLTIAPSNALTSFDVVARGGVNAGISAGRGRGVGDTWHTNFEANWTTGRLSVNAAAQYDRSTGASDNVSYGGSFVGLTRVGVDLVSPRVPGGGLAFDFGGVDITDPARQKLNGFFNSVSSSKTTRFGTNLDMSFNLSSRALLRSVQIGGQYRRTRNSDDLSFRNALFENAATRPGIADIPGASVITVTPLFNGAERVGWAQLDPTMLYRNWSAIRDYIVASNPAPRVEGPGSEQGAAALFGPESPATDDPAQTNQSRENVLAGYGSVNFGFKALFPFSGSLGGRYTRTQGGFTGLFLQRIPVLDGKGQPIPGQSTTRTNTISNNGQNSSFIYNATLTADLLPKLRARAIFSTNIQQPDFRSRSPYRNIDFTNPLAIVETGNPELRPMKTTDLNLELSWFFGRGGIVSIAGYQKKLSDFFYNRLVVEPVPELGGATRLVSRTDNSGRGLVSGLEFQSSVFTTFLPGFMKNFGFTGNATWTRNATLDVGIYELEFDPVTNGLKIGKDTTRRVQGPGVSRWSYNLIGYYETPTFSTRVSYNWRSSYVTGIVLEREPGTQTAAPQKRLDAAINITPRRFLTLSLEGQNLLNSVDRYYYSLYPEISAGLNQMGRTIQLSARFRF